VFVYVCVREVKSSQVNSEVKDKRLHNVPTFVVCVCVCVCVRSVCVCKKCVCVRSVCV